jgi:hypothetical protein
MNEMGEERGRIVSEYLLTFCCAHVKTGCGLNVVQKPSTQASQGCIARTCLKKIN